MVFEVDASYFVKGHDIPQAHQTYLAGAHVVEQICNRGLAT